MGDAVGGSVGSIVGVCVVGVIVGGCDGSIVGVGVGSGDGLKVGEAEGMSAVEKCQKRRKCQIFLNNVHFATIDSKSYAST